MFTRSTVAAQLHFFGSFTALVGMYFLLPLTLAKPDSSHFYACLVFGISSFLVFAASSILHFATDGFKVSVAAEKRMEGIDQATIFLFIAGTYSPVLLNLVAQPWAAILLIAVWSISLAGIAYLFLKSKLPKWMQHRYLNTALYVGMGWILVLRMGEVMATSTSLGAFCLIAGAISYTVGAVSYATERPRFANGVIGYHEIWHLMVLFGFGFHYFMILDFYS